MNVGRHVNADDPDRQQAAALETDATDASFAGVDAMVERWLDDDGARPQRASRASPRDARAAAADAAAGAPRTVCARCHSLTHNG